MSLIIKIENLQKFNLFFLLICPFIVSPFLYGQKIIDKSSSKKPSWFVEKPQSDEFLYYIGMGQDISLQTAKEIAIADILQQLSNEGSFTLTMESKTEIINRIAGNNVETSIDFEANLTSTGNEIKVTGLRKEE